MSDKKTCFVIMPFSRTNDEHTESYWTKHFEDFLKPLQADRATTVEHTGRETVTVFQRLCAAVDVRAFDQVSVDVFRLNGDVARSASRRPYVSSEPAR